MPVIQVSSDAEFNQKLTEAGEKLVVVDFFATWCGPCRTIAPTYEQFSNKYTHVTFLKVNVDEPALSATVSSNAVSAMPTFLFFKRGANIDNIRGVNAAALEEKIKTHGGSPGESSSGPSAVPGQVDLESFFCKSGMECLNESDDHPFSHALTSKGGYLESDCDEQLIMIVGFNENIKLHSLVLKAPADKGPKVIKIFQNIPTLDFDSAESSTAVQVLELTPDDFSGDAIIPLKYVKFQNVQNLVLFVQNNQGGTETTQIDYIGFFGSTMGTTNMTEFKRVAGKKGESH